MAACLRTVEQNQASFLKNSSLVYVHCVSKDDFPIGLAHFSCVKLICREKVLVFAAILVPNNEWHVRSSVSTVSNSRNIF